MRVFLPFFFLVSVANSRPCSQAFLETVETEDKNRDDFHCIQMSNLRGGRKKGREKGVKKRKKGKGKGAPAIRAGFYVFCPPIS